MAFVDQPFDPCYESTSLKDETNGVYGDMFEGFSYDQYDSAEAARSCTMASAKHLPNPRFHT